MLPMHAATPAAIKPDPPQVVVQNVVLYKFYQFASYVNIVIQYSTLSNFWKVRFL